LSAQFETPAGTPPVAPAACPLCGTAVGAEANRCGTCGYHLAGVAGRPSAFTRPAIVWTAIGLVLVYVATLLVVLAAR
jgi:hypothetical protein